MHLKDKTSPTRTQKLLDEMVEATRRMCADSEYGSLFLGLTWYHIYQKAKEISPVDKAYFNKDLVLVRLSEAKDEFAFLPFNWQKYRRAYNLPLDFDCDWQREGELLDRFFIKYEQYYENKRSLMIIKMTRLSEEFTDRLESIGNSSQVPFYVVATLLKIMLRPLPGKGVRPQNSELFIPLPITIGAGRRIVLIKAINKKIMELLYEAFGILTVIAIIETFHFLPIFQGKKFKYDDIKIFLREDMCFPNARFEAWLSKDWKVKHLARVLVWKVWRYGFCHKFLARFVNYVGVIALIKARQKQELIKAPLWTQEHFESWQKRSASPIDYEDAFEYDDFAAGFETQQYDKEILSRVMGSLYDSGIYSDDQTYKLEIVDRFAKLDHKIILSYKLKGSPVNFIAYVSKIIDNIARAILLEEYNEKVKDTLGISLKTLRRYEKERLLQYGNRQLFDSDKLYYSDNEIAQVKKEKMMSQRHKKEGYLTQRELITFFKNAEFINRCQEEGIPIKMQAERIIRKKFELLRELGQIPFEQTKNAILYKNIDIIHIAKELAKLQQENK